MNAFLGSHRDDARLRAIRVAAHTHIVHLLQLPEKVTQARFHLDAVVTEKYGAARELVTASSGLRRDQLESDDLHLLLDALWELSVGAGR
jgi:hypothetical protein